MADAIAIGMADTFSIAGAFGSRGGAGGVVLRRICQNLEFLLGIHRISLPATSIANKKRK